jgi:hypothetical protein
VVLWVKEGSEGPPSRAIQTEVVWHERYDMACPSLCKHSVPSLVCMDGKGPLPTSRGRVAGGEHEGFQIHLLIATREQHDQPLAQPRGTLGPQQHVAAVLSI